MNEAAIRDKLKELCNTMARPPKAAPDSKSDDGLYISHGTGEPSVEQVLETLRLQAKYVVFDLEATRRENRYLRQMLETRPKRGPEEG